MSYIAAIEKAEYQFSSKGLGHISSKASFYECHGTLKTGILVCISFAGVHDLTLTLRCVLREKR